MYLTSCLSRIFASGEKSGEAHLIVVVVEALNTVLEPMTGVYTHSTTLPLLL